MADLAELQKRLSDLRAQRATGVASVRFADGKEVTYRTDAQIAEAIADLEAQIAGFGGQRVQQVRFRTSKGL